MENFDKNSNLAIAIDGLKKAVESAAFSIKDTKSLLKTKDEELANLNANLLEFDQKVTQLFDFEASNGNEHILTQIESKLNNFKTRIESSLKLEEQYDSIIVQNSALLDTNGESIEKLSILPELTEKLKSAKSSYSELEKFNLELMQKIKELEAVHTNYGFAQKEITRKNFEINKKEELILKQKELIAELENKVLKLSEKERDFIKELEEKSNNLSQSSELVLEYEKLKSQLLELESTKNTELSKLSQEVSRYSQEAQKQSDAIRSYHDKLSLNNSDRNKLASEKRDLEEKLADMEAKLSKNEVEKQKQKDHDIEVAALKQDILTKDSKIEDLKLEINRINILHTASDVASGSMAKKLQDYDIKVKELSSKIEELEQLRLNALNRIEVLENELAESTKMTNIVAEQENLELTNDFEQKLNTLQLEKDELLHKYNQVKENYISQLKTLESAESEKNRLLSEFESSKNNFDLAIWEKEELTEAMQNEIIELKSQITNLGHENFQLSQKLSSISEMQIESGELKSQIEILKAEIDNLHQSNFILEADLNSAGETISQLRLKLQELSNNDNAVELQAKLDSLQSSLRSEKQFYSQELEYKVQEIEDLKSKIEDLSSSRQANHELRRKLEEYIAQNEVLSTDLNNLKSIEQSQSGIKEIIADKDNEIRELQRNTWDLENLVKTRYEQIKILEEQLNEKIKEQKQDGLRKRELAAKLEKYVEKIEQLAKQNSN